MESNRTNRAQTSEHPTTETTRPHPRNRDSDPSAVGRREYVRATGGLVVAGLLAGCSGGNDGGGKKSTGGGGNRSVDEWLSETDNYDSVADLTGKKAVTVEVGPSENEYVFEPPAIRIDPGTTVTWRWVGGGHHNVVAADGGFKSGSPEENATFERTFESTGTTHYYCQPHESMGMKGAIIVESGDEGTDGSN